MPGPADRSQHFIGMHARIVIAIDQVECFGIEFDPASRAAQRDP